jgi:hypothetical protein
MIQSQKLATEYGSKGLAIGSGQTMVQKWPNDGSSQVTSDIAELAARC